MSTYREPTPAETERAVINMHRSLTALGASVAALQVSASPQMARGLQATENAWREMESEFGLLTGRQVAELMGSRSRTPTGYATDQPKAGKILGIRRRNAYLYPGFQFTPEGAVLPVIPKLLKVAAKYDKSSEGLGQWLCAPTGQLDGERPVDHLGDGCRVIEAAENHYGVEW